MGFYCCGDMREFDDLMHRARGLRSMVHFTYVPNEKWTVSMQVNDKDNQKYLYGIGAISCPWCGKIFSQPEDVNAESHGTSS